MTAPSAVASLVQLPVVQPMPPTRGGCAGIPRPCPFTSCRYSLIPERRGTVDQGAPSCSLDAAARAGMTLEEIGRAFGVTRERVRQIEAKALRKLADVLARRRLADGPPGAVRARIRALLVGLRP